MAEKAVPPQQPVISIRISEALRLRLETLKVLMSMKSGEPVSTSEAAKQLLESSKEERLELVNLLTDPTDSLLKTQNCRFHRRNGPSWPTTVCTARRHLPIQHRPRFHTNLSAESLRHSKRFTAFFANKIRRIWTPFSSHISRQIGKPKQRNRRRSEAMMYAGL